MPPKRTRSQARLLAPAALLVFVLAVALIVLGSSGSDRSNPTGKTTTAGQRTATTGRTGARPRPRARATYTVKSGDTLGGISQKTKVKVETLQLLNPSLDPQALVSGQKIKLH